MLKCKDCDYPIEQCLNLPKGKKCCPDCNCHAISKMADKLIDAIETKKTVQSSFERGSNLIQKNFV
ncbi:hypothetical protein [Enterococcus faecalis]|uniref:hypothetical protein n=1 Tax=Enterococcus faecalis TaxID=1351 RepID=UPI0034CE7FB1